MVSELLTVHPHGVDTARPFENSKLGRFNRPVRAACGEAGEFPLEQTTLGRDRMLHQAPMLAASCGHRMPARSREAMRTTAWPRTAKPLAFVAAMVAGWLRWSLTFGSNWTLVRIPPGE